MKKLQRTKLSDMIGIYTAIALFAIGIVGFFLIRPLLIDAHNDRVQKNQTQAQIDRLKQLEKDTETLRRNFAAVEDNKDIVLSLLPVWDESEYLLAQLGEVATRHNVILGGYSPEASIVGAAETINTPAAPGMETLSATFSLGGSYTAIHEFLKELETGSRFVDVKAIQFEAQQTTGSEAIVSVRVRINAYYQTTVAGGLR